MKTLIGCLIGLVFGASVSAESLLEGRVRLDSGAPVPGAQVLLFDLADLRAAPLAATTDRSGHFTLPLATLGGALPERFELGANYPNPFNPSTMIPYQLPAAMHVRLEVFNILGQRIATLVDGERSAGFHTTSWDATDAAGQAVAAGVYLYRLQGDGAQITRSMLLIDGQAGGMPAGPGGPGVASEEAGDPAPVYGLTVSGPGLVPYVNPAFRVEAGMAPLDLVVEAPGRVPPAKAAFSSGILGDVDNTGRIDFVDALLVNVYSLDASIVMPNNGDISLGDVNADGQVDWTDAWLIAAYQTDPSDPTLPPGIGEPVVAATAALSPDPSTVSFADDGAWHRFTVEANVPVSVVANPEAAAPRLAITTGSGRGNLCPGESNDHQSRQDGQAIYLAGCAAGAATVELRRASDGTVLRTYTFTVTGSPVLIVESVSVSDSNLTPGQSFTLNATVRNQGTGQSAATTLRYYRSSNRTISTRDTQVGTDQVGALSAAGTSAESVDLTAPSSGGTYYYGACVESVTGEADTWNNCSDAVTVRVAETSPVSSDRDALVALYQATDGPNWTDNTNWLSDRPLRDWHGVTAANGRVTELALEWNRLSGPIPSELGNLAHLTFLHLSENQLTGPIPSELGNLAHLTFLGLRENRLSGPIPSELGNLAHLGGLILSENRLTGPIPSELGNLAHLTSLILGQNRLSGSIPSELGNLASLTELALGGNRLTGSIPSELGNLASLTELGLGGNRLTGPIPSELGNLASLTSLILSWNPLSGFIPSNLTNLTKLEEVSFRLTNLRVPDADFLRWLRGIANVNNKATMELGNLPVTFIYPESVSSPPPTWIFAGDIPEEDQTALREEMEYCRAYFSDRYGVEATGFTVIVGGHEANARVYPGIVGENYPYPEGLAGWVTASATGRAVMVLPYGFSEQGLLSNEHPQHLALLKKQVIAHEYFHVLQGQLASGFAQTQGGEIAWFADTSYSPTWTLEGSAEYGSYEYSLNQVNTNWEQITGNFHALEINRRKGGLKKGDLKRIGEDLLEFHKCTLSHEAPDAYVLSFAGTAFAVEQAEESAYVKYWKLLGERPTWQQAFEEAFDIRVDAFYEAFEAWLPLQLPSKPRFEVRVDWPDANTKLSDRMVLSFDFEQLQMPESSYSTFRYGLSSHFGMSGWHTPLFLFASFPVPPHGATAVLGLWWSDDGCTEHRLGWYMDGELTDKREEATRLELTDGPIEWRLPAPPPTLPRLEERRNFFFSDCS